MSVLTSPGANGIFPRCRSHRPPRHKKSPQLVQQLRAESKTQSSGKESLMGSVSMFPGPSESRAAERGVTALLSVVDAAEVLGVSKHYVQDRINAGELRIVELATNVRQKIRVRADDLQAFIDNRTSAGAA